MSKITEEQLKSLQESQSNINKIVNTIGVLTIQKINIDKKRITIRRTKKTRRITTKT